MVGRLTLDQVVGVRVPAPQLHETPSKSSTSNISTTTGRASVKASGQSMGQREPPQRPVVSGRNHRSPDISRLTRVHPEDSTLCSEVPAQAVCRDHRALGWAHLSARHAQREESPCRTAARSGEEPLLRSPRGIRRRLPTRDDPWAHRLVCRSSARPYGAPAGVVAAGPTRTGVLRCAPGVAHAPAALEPPGSDDAGLGAQHGRRTLGRRWEQDDRTERRG